MIRDTCSGSVDSSQTAPQVNGVGAEPAVGGQTVAKVSGDQVKESRPGTSNLENDVGVSGIRELNQSSLQEETNG